MEVGKKKKAEHQRTMKSAILETPKYQLSLTSVNASMIEIGSNCPRFVFSLRNCRNFYSLACIVLFPSLRLRAHRELHAEGSNLYVTMVKGLLIFPNAFLTQQDLS